MNDNSEDNSAYPYFYCNNCDTYIPIGDHGKFIEHQEHHVVEVKKGDKDPGLISDFKKYGLTMPKGTKEESKESDEKKCLNYVKNEIKKIIISTENRNDVFALVNNHGNFELLDLYSNMAAYWVNYTFKKIDSEVYPISFHKTVLGDLIAEAQMNGTLRENVYLRVAQIDDVFYYDLADKTGELVKITSNGVEIVKFNEDLPLFRKGLTTSKQVRPNLKADIEGFHRFIKLFNLLNDNEEKLFSVNLIAMLLEKCAVPLPFWDGMAGSFKSTNTSLIKLLIDPAGSTLLDNRQAMSDDINNFVLSLYDQYLSALDNITHITAEHCEVLCRGITGAANSKRKLYSDADQVILKFRRKITANGVSPNLNYPDLNDRLIVYSRKSLNDVSYIEESRLEKIIYELMPDVLGFCFTSLSKAISLYDVVKCEISNPKTRLADFEIWGEAISQALGFQKGEFLQLFYNKRKEGAEDNKESYPIIDMILDKFTGNKTEMTETIGNLFEYIKQQAAMKQIDINARYSNIPKSPANLSKALKNLGPIFKKLGYNVEQYRQTKDDGELKKGQSVIKITKIDSPASPASLEDYLETKFDNSSKISGEVCDSQ